MRTRLAQTADEIGGYLGQKNFAGYIEKEEYTVVSCCRIHPVVVITFKIDKRVAVKHNKLY
jgi:hypothetical protein